MLLDIVAYARISCMQPRTRVWYIVPSPGMYAVMMFPLLNLTLATLSSPELGFFGFTVVTRKHTPFNSGLFASAGEVALRAFCPTRQPRITWL